MSETRGGDLFRPGDLVNNTYRIESVLGRGGTSDVYRARSETSGRTVAIKVLKAEFSGNDDYLALLRREEEIREIRDDAVVRYAETHRTPAGDVYLLMDYVEGPGLDAVMREGPVPAEDLVAICRRVAGGLRAAHARGIVHRDLSPDNVILRGGDPAQAVIIDFGIAKDANPGAATIVGGEFAGKYAYAAPEQLAGRSDARSDIYALGALLLAAHRGMAPEVGRNPMEVVEAKGRPLDAGDVPAPLGPLIERMTAPDPEARLQTAQEVLDVLDGAATALSDATVVAPSRAGPRDRDATGRGRQGARPRKGLVAALATLAVLAILAGAYLLGAFDAAFGPRYAAANPFVLTVEKPAGRPLRIAGHAPSPEMLATLVTLAEQEGGTADVALASGGIPTGWAADVLSLIETTAPLDAFALSVEDQSVRLTGTTADPSVRDALRDRFADGMPGGLSGTANIVYAPPVLSLPAVEGTLVEHADCGRLVQAAQPTAGYGPGDPIVVRGAVSSDATRQALVDDLRRIADGRRVSVDAEVLNPTLCLVENYLPEAPAGGVEITLSDGATGSAVPGGVFTVGQNPVIDVLLPPDVSNGFLSVSILDVSGNVFHLLPNVARPDNAVATLREAAGAAGAAAAIRVAYPLDEAAGRVAFEVDDATLGKSKVIVLHSEAPLFDQMRPTQESAQGYAEALRDRIAAGGVIHSLDSRILTTAPS